MEVLYKVHRWCTRESDIAEVKATRQTDKSVWFMQGKRENRELKVTSYYRYFDTREEAVAAIESINKRDKERKSDELIKQSAHALLEALENMYFQGCGQYSKKTCGHEFICVCPEDKARAAIAAARGNE